MVSSWFLSEIFSPGKYQTHPNYTLPFGNKETPEIHQGVKGENVLSAGLIVHANDDVPF